MDLKALDQALQDIIYKKNELQNLDYNNPKYDELEEQLHALEDDFQEKHGDYMEEVLKEVHLKHCPDTDVLYPIAYIAKAYTVTNDRQFDIDPSDGVYVEVDKHPGKETRLALVPNPLRVVLNIGNERQEVVWTTEG